MEDNLVRTEVKLSEESVRKIIAAETLKALSQVDGFMENLISQILFNRPPKQNSYDPVPRTFLEQALQKTFVPILEEEIAVLAETQRGKIRGIIKKVFKANVVDSKEFEDLLINQLSKFVGKVRMYVSSE